MSCQKKEAVIGIPKGSAAPKDAVLAAIAGAAFRGRSESLENRIIPIEGMTCESCAVHVQSNLTKVPGVRSAEVNYKEQKAVVRVDASVGRSALNKAVESAGYKVVSEANGSAQVSRGRK